MTPAFTLQHRNVYLRVDHAVVGACLAAKLARRTDRNRLGDSYRVIGERGEGR
jgi:hypothetical protein